MPRVSVIMAAYNAEKHIKTSINSILNQTLKDIEIIVVNDGSTDKTRQIVENLTGTDPRIKLINTKNNGCSTAGNVGIDNSDSEWVARLDADDFSFPTRLSEQVNHCEQGNFDICGADAIVFGKTVPRIWRYPTTQVGIDTLALFNSPVANPASFYNRSIHVSQRYCKGAVAEDYLFWVMQLKNRKKFTSINKILLAYRIHPAQISSAKRQKQEESRNRVSAMHWENKGFNMPISSMVRFGNIEEVFLLIDELKKMKLDDSVMNICANEVAKMIVRSDVDKLEALSILKKNGFLPGFLLSTIIKSSFFIHKKLIR